MNFIKNDSCPCCQVLSSEQAHCKHCLKEYHEPFYDTGYGEMLTNDMEQTK